MPREIHVSRGERPDIKVLSLVGLVGGLSRSPRYKRPRWPYCSHPWCPNNRVTLERPRVYSVATIPSNFDGEFIIKTRNFSSAFFSVFKFLGSGVLHGRLRAHLHKYIARVASRILHELNLPLEQLRREEPVGRKTLKVELVSDRVVVVGGGLAGLAAALEASSRGLKVVLFEANSYIGGFMKFIESIGSRDEIKVSKLSTKLKDRGGVSIVTDAYYIGYYEEGHAILSLKDKKY